MARSEARPFNEIQAANLATAIENARRHGGPVARARLEALLRIEDGGAFEHPHLVKRMTVADPERPGGIEVVDAFGDFTGYVATTVRMDRLHALHLSLGTPANPDMLAFSRIIGQAGTQSSDRFFSHANAWHTLHPEWVHTLAGAAIDPSAPASLQAFTLLTEAQSGPELEAFLTRAPNF